MEVSGQLYALDILPAGKESSATHWIGGFLSPRAGVDAEAWKKNPVIAPTEN